MSNPLVWDVETVPLESAMSEPWPESEWTPPSNIRDPLKIEERRERAESEWKARRAKECSLNPRLGRIVAMNAVPFSGPNQLHGGLARTEADERQLLLDAWNVIAMSNGQIVTFNGLTFDVPFFLVRTMVHDITPTVPVRTVRDWLRRYSYSPHYDVRSVLTQWDSRTSGTLTDWCAAFGIACDDTTRGSDIYDLYKAGDFDAIASHCRSDVEATAKLYERTALMYGGIA